LVGIRPVNEEGKISTTCAALYVEMLFVINCRYE
jgi:hypothetical protein